MGVYRLGLELGMENRPLAWVLDLPGAYAWGRTPEEALERAPDAMRAYDTFWRQHTGESLLDDAEVAVVEDERFYSYTINESYDLRDDGYEVNAFFRHDWKPLAEDDVAFALRALEFTRADLLGLVQNLGDDELNRTLPGERWPVRGVLGHVANAEWWYLDRIGHSFPRALLPDDVFERLRVVRIQLRDGLYDCIGLCRVVGKDGEIWSPRKVVRRALWHERDHTEHITKLLPSGV